MEKIELEYVHSTKEVYNTIFDFPIVKNVTEYNDASIRNRVILKFDILANMTTIFQEDTLKEYRDLVFSFLSGLQNDAETESLILQAFYKEDSVFHKYLSELYFFDDRVENEPLAFVLHQALIEKYRDIVNSLYNALSVQRCKFILESEGYIYVAIPDELFTLKIPGYFSEEVLSRAKVWSFDFERV